MNADKHIQGYEFDNNADRATVRNVHIRDFDFAKGFGTPVFSVNAGSAQLDATGAFAIQTYAGSAVIVVRSGTVTYYFTCAGTL